MGEEVDYDLGVFRNFEAGCFCRREKWAAMSQGNEKARRHKLYFQDILCRHEMATRFSVSAFLSLKASFDILDESS